jgi:APA family basic amino acid/polyamine antiporter
VSKQSELVRAVGPFGLTAIAVNGVIGSGMFVMPATVAALLGRGSPTAYVVAAAAAILIALSFAEAGSYYDRAGGPYIYAREAFGDFIGFEVGWMFLFARVAGAAAVTNAFAAYAAYFQPALGRPVERALVIGIAIAAIGALNYVGVQFGATALNIFTVGKLLPLFAFVGIGLFFVDWHTLFPPPAPALGPLREASLVLLFALGGFEFASVPTEEVIDSRRYLPFALIAGLGFSAVVYILVQMVCVGTLPNLAHDAAPIANAAARFIGPSGAALMAVGALLSSTGTDAAILLVGPRMLYALAQGGQLPKVFGRVHPRFRTPSVAVVLFTAATIVLAVSGTFAALAALNAIGRLLYSITTCAAVPILRRRYPADQRKFTLPGAWLLPALGILASLILLSGITTTQALIGAGGLLSGAIVYAARKT